MDKLKLIDVEWIKDCIQNLYGVDVRDSSVQVAVHSFMVLSEKEPYAFHVFNGDWLERKGYMSRINWVDELKRTNPFVSNVLPSKNGELIEIISHDKMNISICMYTMPEGIPSLSKSIQPMNLICMGEALGRIHSASRDMHEKNINFDMVTLLDEAEHMFEKNSSLIPSQVKMSITRAVMEVKNIRRTPDNYGVIMGNYAPQNIHLNGNNVWMYNFENVCYGYYLYDVATCILSVLLRGYKTALGAGKSVEDMMKWFSLGYGFCKKIDADYFADLKKFIKFRAVMIYLYLHDSEGSQMMLERDMIKIVFEDMIAAANVYDGINAVLSHK